MVTRFGELTEKERRYLVDVLVDRLGVQRQSIYHADTSSFKDAMKQEEVFIRHLIDKLAYEPILKSGT